MTADEIKIVTKTKQKTRFKLLKSNFSFSMRIKTKENVIIEYSVVLSSYYHMILIFDQNHKNILNLAGGSHF